VFDDNEDDDSVLWVTHLVQSLLRFITSYMKAGFMCNSL